MKILVTGSTGTMGSELIKELGKRNVEIRALIHDEGKRGRLPRDVEVAVGDLLDPVSARKALDGVDKVYLLNAVVPDELTQGLIVYDVAKSLNIRQVVYHSVFEAQRFKDVPHFAAKFAMEAALQDFDAPWTILRPNYFYQNDARLKQPLTAAGVYPMPLGPQGVSAVDVRDIAEAAAIALTTDGHLGKTYNLVGPQVLSGPEAASIWSEVLQRQVRYMDQDFDAWEEQMRQNLPAWSAFDMRMMFEGYVERGFSANDGDVEALTEVLGHAPRSYRDFAQETAAAWQKERR